MTDTPKPQMAPPTIGSQEGGVSVCVDRPKVAAKVLDRARRRKDRLEGDATKGERAT